MVESDTCFVKHTVHMKTTPTFHSSEHRVTSSAISIVPRDGGKIAVTGSFTLIIGDFKPLPTNYISN